MAKSEVEVAIVGGGAAGIAAGRRLHDAGVDCLIVEARDAARRAGAGRVEAGGLPIDLGCGWLHSGDRNPWTEIAKAQGRTIDKTPPPWMRPALPVGFRLAEQPPSSRRCMAFYRAHRRLSGERSRTGRRRRCLTRAGAGTTLINAVSTYINGAELGRISATRLRPLRRHRRELARRRRLRHDDRRARRRRAGSSSAAR